MFVVYFDRDNKFGLFDGIMIFFMKEFNREMFILFRNHCNEFSCEKRSSCYLILVN